MPLYVVALRLSRVQGCDSGAFHAEQLAHRRMGQIFAGESHRVHSSGDHEAGSFVGYESGLLFQKSGGAGECGTAAIVADSLLSGPYDDRAGVACQDDGIMCDGCAGPEHEYRDGSDRQCGFAVLVRRYQRIVRAFDDTQLFLCFGYRIE